MPLTSLAQTLTRIELRPPAIGASNRSRPCIRALSFTAGNVWALLGIRMDVVPNSRGEIARRVAAGSLTWSGPALMLFARSLFSFLAQGLVAGIYARQSSPAPWLAAARWLPVYAVLIDAGYLTLLWVLTRREDIALRDLIRFDGTRWPRDMLLAPAR